MAGPRHIPGDSAEACTGGAISGPSVQAWAHLHTSWGEMGAVALRREAKRWGLALPGEGEHGEGSRLFAVLKQESFVPVTRRLFPIGTVRAAVLALSLAVFQPCKGWP